MDDDIVIIAVDSTGIKVTNRDQWMQDKWDIGKKDYPKIHVAVNIKTKKILAIDVIGEKVPDSKIMIKLVEDVLSNHNTISILS